jgi:hypothetical protein
MLDGFVEQSKGRLQIRSEPGRGTTVTLDLPRAPEGGTETNLLVDDDPRLRAAAASQLRALGYQVRPVGSAAEALDTLRPRKIDRCSPISASLAPWTGAGLRRRRG